MLTPMATRAAFTPRCASICDTPRRGRYGCAIRVRPRPPTKISDHLYQKNGPFFGPLFQLSQSRRFL